MSELLPCVERNPATPAKAAVIWLHGLGADGNDFVPMAHELGLAKEKAVRFLFPHAPTLPVTVNNGVVMPAWFDVFDFNEERKINVAQLLASAAAVHALIDSEVENGIASERILLGGFSQGGAVILQAALTYDKPLAGLVALSTYFPTGSAVEVHPANSALPILLCHGTTDALLPVSQASNARRHLERLGLHPKFLTYPIGHGICPEEVRDIANFVKAHL